MEGAKIKLDNKTSSALACGQVASNPRVTRRNLAETQVFLCPQYERTVGCAWGIQHSVRGNTHRRFLSRLEAPGSHSKADHSKIDRRFTMSTPSVHPHDRLHHVQIKIEFLATLLNIVNEDDRINFDHPGNANGLHYTLTGFAEEISTAITALEKDEVAA